MSSRENDRVAGAGNSVYAEKAGGYAGPRDPKLNPEPRQEGQATIKNNPEFEAEMERPAGDNSSADPAGEMSQSRDKSDLNDDRLTPEDLADRPLPVTPQGP
ncbi:MAG: hypothetical protein V4692_16510 [Bdellovibrionota bacterium]